MGSKIIRWRIFYVIKYNYCKASQFFCSVKAKEQNHVRDWNVLNTAKKYDDILRIAEYYRSEGISNAVILSTSDELVVPPEESAKFFRVYYNLFTIAKVVVHLPLGG